MNTFVLENIPFVQMDRRLLREWTCKKLSEYHELVAVGTTYVRSSDLEGIVDELRSKTKWSSVSSMVWSGSPAFMSASWVPKYSKKDVGYDYRFDTGLYRPLDRLLLVDDLVKWVHHQINDEQVRTAKDLVWQMAGNTTPTPAYL